MGIGVNTGGWEGRSEGVGGATGPLHHHRGTEGTEDGELLGEQFAVLRALCASVVM